MPDPGGESPGSSVCWLFNHHTGGRSKGMSYIREAFEQTCREAKAAEGWYVSLLEAVQFYGGPEEGGWWGEDVVLVAYQYYPTEEQARAAQEAVEELARELEAVALREYGELCRQQMDWLEARGLDADYLPENDGPSEFHVVLSQGLPEESRGCRQYS
jgi:hypothetical protein